MAKAKIQGSWPHSYAPRIFQINTVVSGPYWSCGHDQLGLFLKIGLATGNHVGRYHL